MGPGNTIYINDVEPVSRGKLQLDGKDEAELVNAIKFGPKDQIREVIQRLVVRMGDAKVHVRQHQLYMLSIVNCITQLMQQYDFNPGDMFRVQEQYTDILSAIQRREEFEDWILQVAYRMNAVSYTHLDVYKRQPLPRISFSSRSRRSASLPRRNTTIPTWAGMRTPFRSAERIRCV